MKPWLLLPVALFAAGCGHVETHVALLRAAEPPVDGRVELYMADQAPPAREYDEVALVEAIGFGNEASPETLADALTARARKLGCNAVVHTFIDQGYARSHAAGVCVKWLGPPVVGGANEAPLLPPDASEHGPRIPKQPAPLPRMEPFPSAAPSQGGGR